MSKFHWFHKNKPIELLIQSRFDFLFDDDNDEIESYGSYLTDDEDFRFPFDHNLTDNDDDDEDDDETYDAWR